MKKLILLGLIVVNLVASDKSDIVSLCVEDGYSKNICECVYDKTLQEVNLDIVLKSEETVEKFDETTIEYKVAVEILNDYNTIFEMKLDECKIDKLKQLWK